MPKTSKSGRPRKDELPATIERSDPKAQRTFAKAHDSAAEEYGDEQRAHQVAYCRAQAHPREGRGPLAAQGPQRPLGRRALRAAGAARPTTAGGVDANASKKHLQAVARELDIRGRSTMTKDELVEAIGRANDRASARARRAD